MKNGMMAGLEFCFKSEFQMFQKVRCNKMSKTNENILGIIFHNIKYEKQFFLYGDVSEDASKSDF